MAARALLKYMDVANSTRCCLPHPSLCCGYHWGSCMSYPAYFLSCARPPVSIPVKPSKHTSWRTAGNSTGAAGPLWGEQTFLHIQSKRNTRRTILDSFTTLTTIQKKKKKSHLFLNKLLSVSEPLTQARVKSLTNLGFLWKTEWHLGVLTTVSWLCLKKKIKQTPWSAFTSRRAPKQRQDNKEHAGARRLLNATIYVLQLAVPRHHLHIQALTSSL